MIESLNRIALVVLIITGTISTSCVSSASKSRAVKLLADVKPKLQDGDLIFIRLADPIFVHVAETMNSWETHVGIIFHDSKDGWTVYESTVPLSKKTPLDKFVAHADEQRFTIRRARKNLTYLEKDHLRLAAASRLGKFYHLGFKYDSSRQYCSKLVHDTYLDATGREVGRIETFRKILAANPEAPVWFWRLWFFGFIPWERRCVTTTSELKDKNFVTVFDTEIANHKKKEVSR